MSMLLPQFKGLRILCLLVLTAGSATAQSTYFVRADGAAAGLCNGLVDAPYPGEGSNQPCAWQHPFDALPPSGVPRIGGGDTLVIGPGSYRIGLDATGDDSCDALAPEGCHLSAIPSGPDAANPTRIVGVGWNTGCSSPPELWGAEGAAAVIDLAGSRNVIVACLEITDHAGCVIRHGKDTLRCEDEDLPFGDWADTGIRASDSSNVWLTDLNVHGLARNGIEAARLENWTLDNVRLAANGWAGWDGAIPGGDGNSGTFHLHHCVVEWNGCAETYPSMNPIGCWDAAAGGYGDGIGIGSSAGRWIIEDSEFLYNTQDGLDLGSIMSDGTVEVRRSHFRGNSGNQLKIRGVSVIENSIIVGSCASFESQPFTFSVDSCRGLGAALAIDPLVGGEVVVVNNTMTGQGNCLTSVDCGSKPHSQSAILFRNNIFQGQPSTVVSAAQACLADSQQCADGVVDFDYSVISEVGGSPCPGANDICGENAGLVNDSISSFDAHVYPSSPAVDSGLPSGVLIPSEDYSGLARPYGIGVDRGAYELGSISQAATRTPTVTPTATPTPRPTISRDEKKCRKQVRKQLSCLVKTGLQAMQKCIESVNDGSFTGTCPNEVALASIAVAMSKVTAEDFDRLCPAEVLSMVSLGGSCAGATSGADLVTCIRQEADTAVNDLLDAEYATRDAVIADPPALDCQIAIAAKGGRTYANKRLKVSVACLRKLDSGRVPFCTDPISQNRIDAARVRFGSTVDSRCSDELVLSLQSAGGFGGACANAVTLEEIITCQMIEHDAVTDRLLEVMTGPSAPAGSIK